jgi:hypothetical protein
MIWRRLLVRDESTLADLHHTIPIAQKFIGHVDPGHEPTSRARSRIPIRSEISEISAPAE